VPVLIVDDNETNRRLLADWVSHWGMWPMLAESAPTAIKILESLVHNIPLVLTDVHMTEMDGFELLQHIKRTTQTPTVIMLTSDSYTGDVERSRELGAAAYMIKPVRQAELLLTIQRVLKTHAPAPNPISAWHGSIQQLEKELRPKPSTDALRILVAEDNIINQRYAVNLLESEGHEVVVVGNGQEAATALERECFHVVLMDVQMPVMDGFEATSVIRAREKSTGIRTPIIAMTAHAMGGYRDKCLRAGMDAYVSKPIRRSELMKTITSMTAKSEFGAAKKPNDSRSDPESIAEEERLIR
jgi:CheY-like chemotaxis protein